MATKTSNKGLIITVIILSCAAIPLLLSDKSVDHQQLEYIPEPGDDGAGDDTVSTLKTIQAEVKKVTEANKEISEHNKTLVSERAENIGKVERIGKQNEAIARDLARLSNQKDKDHNTIRALRSQIQNLNDKLSQMKLDTVKPKEDINSVLPPGFGFDSGTSVSSVNSGSWKKRIDAPEDEEEKNSFGLVKNRNNKPQGSAQKSEKIEKIKSQNSENYKHLTIPLLGTGINATTLTALVGRIPVKGKIPDPYKFKLILNSENLLANGIELPEVEGIVLQGKARGDWNLSCVAGDIYKMTYIFSDGRIVSTRSEGDSQRIAWISDEYGFPCVSGRFVTNAPAFLSQRAGLTALGVAAEAYAEAQRTTQQNLLGTTSFISGSTGKNALGKASSAAVKDINNWLLERQQQSFDAVVSKAGLSIGVHFEEAIEIDYDSNNRKVRYANTKKNKIQLP